MISDLAEHPLIRTDAADGGAARDAEVAHLIGGEHADLASALRLQADVAVQRAGRVQRYGAARGVLRRAPRRERLGDLLLHHVANRHGQRGLCKAKHHWGHRVADRGQAVDAIARC